MSPGGPPGPGDRGLPASSDFEIQTVMVGSAVTVLRVRGRLDARGAQQMNAACAEVRAKHRNLVLNLGGVSFVASSGVGALLALVEEFRQSDCKVRLAEVPPAVDSVIHLLNLRPFLSISPNEAHATSALEAA
jgi:anti-anti-sigma factor